MGTAVRISDHTKRVLEELAAREGKKIRELVDEAVELYRRRVFLEEVNRAYRSLREDPAAWVAEEEERRVWEATLGDGLQQE